MRRCVVKVELDLGDACALSLRGLRKLVDGALEARPFRAAAKRNDLTARTIYARQQREPSENWVSVADLFGSNVIPEEAARVIGLALARAQRNGAQSLLGALEALAADYLAGPVPAESGVG